MIKKSYCVVVLMLSLIVTAPCNLAEKMHQAVQATVVLQNNPPFVYTNEHNEFLGSDIAKLKPILEQSGVHYELLSVSWKRALAQLKKKPNVLGFPVSRTPAREKLFKWIIPLHTIKYHLFAVKNKFDSKLSDIDSGKYSFICSDKTVACSVLENFGAPASSIVKISHVNNKQIIDMVVRERVDFMLFTDEEFDYFLNQMEYDRSQFSALDNYNYELTEYLVSNLQFDDQLIEKIRDAAQSVKAK